MIMEKNTNQISYIGSIKLNNDFRLQSGSLVPLYKEQNISLHAIDVSKSDCLKNNRIDLSKTCSHVHAKQNLTSDFNNLNKTFIDVNYRDVNANDKQNWLFNVSKSAEDRVLANKKSIDFTNNNCYNNSSKISLDNQLAPKSANSLNIKLANIDDKTTDITVKLNEDELSSLSTNNKINNCSVTNKATSNTETKKFNLGDKQLKDQFKKDEKPLNRLKCHIIKPNSINCKKLLKFLQSYSKNVTEKAVLSTNICTNQNMSPALINAECSDNSINNIIKNNIYDSFNNNIKDKIDNNLNNSRNNIDNNLNNDIKSNNDNNSNNHIKNSIDSNLNNHIKNNIELADEEAYSLINSSATSNKCHKKPFIYLNSFYTSHLFEKLGLASRLRLATNQTSSSASLKRKNSNGVNKIVTKRFAKDAVSEATCNVGEWDSDEMISAESIVYRVNNVTSLERIYSKNATVLACNKLGKDDASIPRCNDISRCNNIARCHNMRPNNDYSSIKRVILKEDLISYLKKLSNEKFNICDDNEECLLEKDALTSEINFKLNTHIISNNEYSTGKLLDDGICARSQPYLGRFQYFKPYQSNNSLNYRQFKRRHSSKFPRMEFQRMRSTYKKSLQIQPSIIHGFGLFAIRDFEVEEMIAEYTGEVIRLTVANRRELEYEAKKKGCYMFQLEDDLVIDATKRGGISRYMNHSCQPNCDSRILRIDGRPRIIIHTLCRVRGREELTYNYRFDKEEAKIVCRCRAAGCQKFLN